MTDNNQGKEWDVFVSYASEDREAVASPLTALLKAFGVSVWFDQLELKVGDSLRRKIDHGLTHCKYGIVILSPNFFRKEYPNKELDGLAQHEFDGRKMILPVWYNLGAEQVRKHSPTLADRLAADWKDGIHIVAVKLLEVIRPELLDKLSKENPLRPLARISTGGELRHFIDGAESSLLINDELKDQSEIDLVASFLEEIHDWLDIWDDIGPKGQAEAQLGFSRKIDELHSSGWTLWGGQEKHIYKVNNPTEGVVPVPVTAVIIAIVRGTPVKVVRNGDGIIIVK